MTLVIPSTDENIISKGEKGRIPDFITRGLSKPSFGVGARIRGAYTLGKALYKSGAYKKVIRYYSYRNRYRIGIGTGTGILASQFLAPPRKQLQARNRFQRYNRRKQRKRCPPCRRRRRSRY